MTYAMIDIVKSYQIGKVSVEALRGISIELKPGEFVALQGPSGSGKSTLLNVLGLIEKPSSGRVVFLGQDLSQADDKTLTNTRQDQIGFIFQNFNLVPVLSALENVEYALYLEQRYSKAVVRERAMQCLKEVGLERFVKHKPSELSGGQRQRVAIARALVKQPKLIIADEPTANLDSKTAEQILALIKDLKERMKTSVIVATHDQATAAMAQRIIRIKDGRLDETERMS
jgi:putative ABC transport system ATP-binding protein